MPIIVPNAGSTYATCQVIPNSSNRWAWFTLTPAVGGSAQATIYAGSGVDGSPLLPLTAGVGVVAGPFGPFNSPCGYYAACIIGGCVSVWLRTAS